MLNIRHSHYEVRRLDQCREFLLLQERFEQVIGQSCCRVFGKALIFGGSALSQNVSEEAGNIYTFVVVGMVRERFGLKDQRELFKEHNKVALTLPGINVRVAYALSPFKSQCLFGLIQTGIEF